MAKSNKANLTAAKKAKNDEFYTKLEDIAKELSNYVQFFDGKTIFLNCDDPEWSNFWVYFHQNFEDLGLKKLVSTHYEKSDFKITQIPKTDKEGNPKVDKDGNPIMKDVVEEVIKKSYKMEYDGGNDRDVKCWKQTSLDGNGDFRSEECIEILRECDICVTNPPFSIARKDFIPLLIKEKKDFIIVGDLNWITYKDVFPLLKNGQMWVGYNDIKEFITPDGSVQKFGNKLWYTSLPIPRLKEPFVETLRYKYDRHPEWYQKYDNYDAINVDEVERIPYDYMGVMGVPITYLAKHNPDEFEIVGLAPERLSDGEASLQIKRYKNATQHNDPNHKDVISGKKKLTESGGKVNDGPAFLLDKQPLKYPYYTCPDEPGKFLRVLYARVLIKRKEEKGEQE